MEEVEAELRKLITGDGVSEELKWRVGHASDWLGVAAEAYNQKWDLVRTMLHLQVARRVGVTAEELVGSVTDDDAASALYYACRFGAPRDVKVALLAAGVSLTSDAFRGVTGLHGTADSGDEAFGAMLIALGADPNARARIQEIPGGTPLHFAAWGNRSQMIRLLVRAGADASSSSSARMWL